MLKLLLVSVLALILNSGFVFFFYIGANAQRNPAVFGCVSGITIILINCVLFWLVYWKNPLRNDWVKIKKKVKGFYRHGVGYLLIDSALVLMDRLEKNILLCPDVYISDDNTIWMEWHLPNEIIMRIEVEDVGKGQIMTTFADKPAIFIDIKW